MNAARVLARAHIRSHPASLLLVAALVCAVTTVVLVGAAGARRTATVYERFLDATSARDMSVGLVDARLPTEPDLVERISSELSQLEGVRAVTTARVGYLDAGTEFDFSLVWSEDGYLEKMDRPVVLDGRMPGPDASGEVALSEGAAAELGLGVGDELSGGTFSAEEIAALVSGGSRGFRLAGPEQRLEVVGVVRWIGDLSAGATPVGIVSSDQASRGGGVGSPTAHLMLDVEAPGPDVTEVVSVLQEAVPTAEVWGSSTEDELGSELRSSYRTLAIGLAVATAVGALAGVFASGQAVQRQVRAAGEAESVARSLGVDRRWRATALAVPPVVAVATGVAVGVVLSVPATVLFPLGSARLAESDPGIRLDFWATVLGALAVLVVLGAWTVLAATRTASHVRPDDVPAVPRLRVPGGLGPSGTVGLRLLGAGAPTRAAVPVAPAVFALALAVAGAVAVSVLVATTRDVAASPERFGWAWTSTPDMLSDTPEEEAAEIMKRPEIAAAGLLACAPSQVGGESLYACAIEERKGSMSLPLVEGRLPADGTEVALGGVTMREAGLAIGDSLELPRAGRGSTEVRIVGEAMLPILHTQDPGRGVVTTMEAIEGSPGMNRHLVLSYPGVADPAAFEATLEESHDVEFTAYGRPRPPGVVAQLEEMQLLLVGLGSFLGVLGLFGLAHFLALSDRRRRSDFAILRSIGFARAQVRRVVAVQTLVIVAVAVAIGLPVGIAAGRAGWLSSVGGLGIIDKPTVPVAVVVAIVIGAPLAALAMAYLPARFAASRSPTAALRVE